MKNFPQKSFSNMTLEKFWLCHWRSSNINRPDRIRFNRVMTHVTHTWSHIVTAHNPLFACDISKYQNFHVPDYRDPKCAFVQYDEDLPSASVIIVFFDEPYSVVIRTVWSVLNTGGKYVQEVILVDDASTLPELGAKLDYYILTRFPKSKIRVVRLQER